MTPGLRRRRFFRRQLLPIPPVPAGRPTPTADASHAAVALADLISADVSVPVATRTRLYEPSGAARATVILWHGFTNAPPQFAPVAYALAEAGLRVLLPRMPRHGEADVLTQDLAQLSVVELVEHVDACVDVAAGFGDPVWVIGLSAGATLAAWAAATRAEVSRVVLAAPLVAPKGLPLPLVRVLVRFPVLVPDIYFWWDPRKRELLGHGPYVYPGFPMPGILPYLHMSEALFDHAVTVCHPLERCVLVDNPNDYAIRRDAARLFAAEVLADQAQVHGIAHIDPTLGWMHDFVDPHTPGTGSTEQVSALLLAALGVGDPAAGGVLVDPLVDRQDEV